jgi:dihydroorotase
MAAFQTTEIEITQPDDFHHHFRDGDVLATTAEFESKAFGHALAMPNLNP